MRGALGLPEPPRRWYLLPVATLVLATVFVGLAAAQPVIELDRTNRVRTDAEAIIALDTTRSMLARTSLGSRSRIARARAAALALRQAIPEVPVGLASVTDRTLPYLFPSPDELPFRTTLARSMGVDKPPPLGTFLTRATRLESLAAVPNEGFFSPTARRRVLVVLTDGETLPPTKAHLAAAFAKPPGVRSLFVHVWGAKERVFAGRLPVPDYRPDPTSRLSLERFASEIGGKVFSEHDLSVVRQALREDVGSGPTVVRGKRKEHVALAPFLAGAAFLPLTLLLWRRDR